jgi:hypothetical protein
LHQCGDFRQGESGPAVKSVYCLVLLQHAAIHFKPIGMLEYLALNDRPLRFVQAKIAGDLVRIPAKNHAAKIENDVQFGFSVVPK